MIELFTKNTNINLIIKTAGNTCNINCSYCFEHPKNVAQNGMTNIFLKDVFEKIENNFSVVFHGGEPLIIGKEKFAELLSVVREYYRKKIISVKIQTNGTLLDEEWLDIFYEDYKDLDIEIAISLDGTEFMNRLRVDYFNENTFLKVIKVFKVLERRNKKFGILSVISKNSLKYYKERL